MRRVLLLTRLWAFLVVMFIAAVATIGHAQPSDADKQQGVAHYKNGRSLLSAKKYDEALAELDASVKLLPSPNTELLRGHALRALGRLAEAMESYQSVKREAGAKVRNGEKRYRPSLEEAGRYSAVLETKLGQVAILVKDASTDAAVTLNGRTVTLAADGRAQRWHEPGDATVSVSTPDGREQSQQVTVAIGDTSRVEITLPPLPVAPSAEEATQPEPVVEEDGDDFPAPPLLALIPAAVGVAGFALFAGFGAASATTASDLDKCAPACAESERDAADDGERNQLIANIGLGVGIAGVAGFGVWWLVDALTGEGTEEDAALQIDVGPGGVSLVGSF